MESAENHAGSGLPRIAVFLGLFSIAIPWYWNPLGLSPDARIGGMPAWFVVAILGSFVISLKVAWQLRQPWQEVEAKTKDDDLP